MIFQKGQPSRILWALVAFCLVMSVVNFVRHLRNKAYVRSLAQDIVSKSGATDPESKVIAIRDYVRSHVTYQEYPQEGRPFLRSSAADILRSGKGWCGEVSRACIHLASELGIKAQRINLTGKVNHVVAEVEFSPDRRMILDCQNPPMVQELESLDSVIDRPEFADYYTINLRRLRISWLVSRIRLQSWAVSHWLESPHFILATFWFLGGCLLALKRGLRTLLREILRRRGWVHTGTLRG
ncbi:MAG: transglutaminase domain-containing protein [Elusimicrobia bacterium]|nr:transglutaminase domain-containing protein [Elusimicrobiota bacterium]